MTNPYAKQAKQYQRQEIETAGSEQLLLLLYDGAIRFLNFARQALAQQEYEKSNDNLLKAQRIITELMTSLDFETGGEIAQNLYRLYDYYNYRLVQANLHKDLAMLDEVIKHLRELKGTWEEAIQISAKEKQSDEEGASIRV